MSDIATILESFTRLEGVHGALVLGPDGSVVEEHFIGAGDSAALAEMVRRSVEVGDRLAAVFGKSAPNQEYVEFSESQVTAEKLKGGRLLVILADPAANLGRIRLEIRKNKLSVESNLS